MFLKTPGSIKVRIKDLYDVHLPPIPSHGAIEGWDLKRSDQFWRRHPLPSYYEERREEELFIQDKERLLIKEGIMKVVKHFDPTLEKYRRQEWSRRILGHWFMNDGVPVYITGSHYFYLQWSKFDHPENDSYPLFYENQVPRYYFRQLCYEDPWSLGYIIIGARGFGKTSEEVSVQMENLTRPGHRRIGAIQSKSENDAGQVLFKEKSVPLFNELPDFFKPVYSHGTDPEKKMVFKRESAGGDTARKAKFGPDYELGNMIRFFPAKDLALDGKTCADVINDEVGKTDPKKEADVYKRTGVNVKVVWRNNVKRGLLRETSTVELMDKGGDQCFEVWKESNPNERDPNGYTTSKLYKYFVSATEVQSQFVDRHGRIPLQKAYDFIMGERKPVEADAQKLSGVMRKNPITEEEAFIKDASKCMFDIFILTARIQQLKMMSKLPGRVGDFHWVDDKVDGDVEFLDNPLTGKVTIWEMPDVSRGTRKIANACSFTYTQRGKKEWLPCNDDIFGCGGDPIRYTQTSDNRASKMAVHGFYKFDHSVDTADMPRSEWRSYNIAWKYHGRSDDPEDDYEQVIMGLRFYGHSILPESNIGEFNKHLDGRGYRKFRLLRKHFDASVLQQKKGVANEQSPGSVPEVQESYIGQVRSYIFRHGKRCPDLKFLEQCRDFDSSDTTKSDLVVSMGYTLIAIKRTIEVKETQEQVNMMKNLFPKFDNRGTRSRRLPMDNEKENGDMHTIHEVLGIINQRR